MPAVARTSLGLATQGDQSTDLARARKPIIFATSSSEDQTLWTTASSYATRAITPCTRAETTVSGQWLGAKAIIRTTAGSSRCEPEEIAIRWSCSSSHITTGCRRCAPPLNRNVKRKRKDDADRAINDQTALHVHLMRTNWPILIRRTHCVISGAL